MKTSKLVLVVAVVFCFVSSIAYAQNINKRGPCKTDIEKFCKNVKSGQGRITKCIQQHEEELSPACMGLITEAREKNREFQKACKSDIESFCQNVKPGQGRIIQCLKGNTAVLSLDCGVYFKK